MRLPLLAAASLASVLLLPAAAPAEVVWLCKPGMAANPCAPGLDATAFDARGKRLRVERTARALRPATDCFYVYPTVSDEDAPSASKARRPEIKATARFQAGRFSEVCRVFAPVYRQITLKALFGGATATAAMRERAYADVREAWRAYLRTHNRGRRGVVLLGHSQGSFQLRRLVREEIETNTSSRALLVSALLLGGNVTVKRGSDAGGDFRRIRACRSSRQAGCVVAYSAFGEQPPAEARFGRTIEASREILCTNPAALGGGTGSLRAYVPTAKFPGTLGVGIALTLGELPKVSTPWIAQPASYRARCSRAGGANVLRIRDAPGARHLPPVPDANWGLHLGDVNLAAGNLVALVRRQAAAWRAAR